MLDCMCTCNHSLLYFGDVVIVAYVRNKEAQRKVLYDGHKTVYIVPIWRELKTDFD